MGGGFAIVDEEEEAAALEGGGQAAGADGVDVKVMAKLPRAEATVVRPAGMKQGVLKQKVGIPRTCPIIINFLFIMHK